MDQKPVHRTTMPHLVSRRRAATVEELAQFSSQMDFNNIQQQQTQQTEASNMVIETKRQLLKVKSTYDNRSQFTMNQAASSTYDLHMPSEPTYTMDQAISLLDRRAPEPQIIRRRRPSETTTGNNDWKRRSLQLDHQQLVLPAANATITSNASPSSVGPTAVITGTQPLDALPQMNGKYFV